ncbi:MAG: hypothetical protein J5764_05575 [Bacteroidales bacterium]|nr:hypothetical protein [Bacteroidales bacterium]
MKKSILCILALAALFAACTKEVSVNNDGITILSANLPGDDTDCRVAIGEKSGYTYPVIWTAGDQISVNGCASSALSAGNISNAGKNASFEINGLVSQPFHAVYPLSAVASYSEGEYTVTLPEQQTYTENSFDPDAAIMLASSDGTLQFQNVLAYLKLTVANAGEDATIESVRVVANGGEAISGTFSAIFGSTCSLDVVQQGSSVVLDCGEGVSLGTPMIIAIPAKTYASGLNIWVYTKDGNYQKVKSSASFTAVAGKIYNTSFNYSPSGSGEVGIYTEADLIAFLNAADGGVACNNWNARQADKTLANFGDYQQWIASDGKVHIKNDITLTHTIDWSSDVSRRECAVSNFDGYLDGEGHTITVAPGTTWNTPLFINLYGTIADLTLEGEMTVGHVPTLGSPLANVVQDGGCISGCANKANITYSVSDHSDWPNLIMGGICSFLFNGTVENCVNYGTLNAGGKVTAIVRVGGICASSTSNAVISNCTNYGDIQVSTVKYEGDNYLADAAGICAYTNGTTVTGCSNRAEVFNVGTARLAGGIVSTAGGDVVNCHNYCPIVQSSENTVTTFGGVVNNVLAECTVRNCSNNAELTVGGSPSVGGVLYMAYGNVDGCTNNGSFVFDGNAASIVAGVCRRVEAGGTLSDCHNTADVDINCSYFGGVAVSSIGTVTGCTNSGNLTFVKTTSRAGGIMFNNEAVLTDCSNSGTITGNVAGCNIAGIVVMQSPGENVVTSGCTNSGPINVTGKNTRAAGICFNMRGGIISNCSNTADITFNLAPTAAGEIAYIGGIVGIVSQHNFSATNVANVFATTGSNSPVTTYADNILESRLTIENCTNTGHLYMEVTASSTSVFLRNVAIGGILAWNWAATTDDNYLEIKNCTNGVSTATSATQYYYVRFYQTSNCPSYFTPAVGGIVGQSAPYNIVSNQSVSPFTEGYAADSWRDGMKIVIDGCNSYGAVVNMEAYCGSANITSPRTIRGLGGIAGMLYGSKNDGQTAVVKNCLNTAYTLSGNNSNYITQNSKSNCTGGIIGCGAYVEVDNCTVTGMTGSTGRYNMAVGGVIGAALERFCIKNCTLHMKSLGYKNNQSKEFWGLAVGVSAAIPRSKGYTTLEGSEIKNNKFLPEAVQINGNSVSVTSSNFADYIISAADAADNATKDWVTISGNVWE